MGGAGVLVWLGLGFPSQASFPVVCVSLILLVTFCSIIMAHHKIGLILLKATHNDSHDDEFTLMFYIPPILLPNHNRS